jgi:hypothetical protein
MIKEQPTPLPWAVWQLVPESDQEQRHIIVTSDGEQEITGIVQREADARHLVRCANLHGELVQALHAIANIAAGALANVDAMHGMDDSGPLLR